MKDVCNTLKVRQIWLSKQLRIVSFHFVNGFQYIEFSDPEMFLHYAQKLVQEGFRFQ